MKILHIIPSIDPTGGGPIEGVLRMGDILLARGFEQSLLTLDDPEFAAGFTHDRNVHAEGRPYRTGDGLIDRALNWARYSPEALAWGRAHLHEYDVVVVNSLWNYSTRLARQLLVGSGKPYVVYPHGMLDPWFRKRYPHKHALKQALWLFNEGVLIRNASAVMFTCEQERLLARKTFWPYRAREQVVSYGAAVPPPAEPVQEAAFRSMMPALGDRAYLLYFSRIHEKKGCDMLIDAFARVAQQHPEVDLVMAGPGAEGLVASLKQQAAARGIAARIHWPGMVTGPAKYGAYRGALAFVLPSHQENFGIVVAEALACGCPALISDQVNIWREIADAGAGLVAPDTPAGTDALLRGFLALSKGERQAMGARGLSLFEQRFTIEAAADSMLAVLEAVTGRI